MSRDKLSKDWTEAPGETPAEPREDAEVQVYTPGSLAPKKKNRSVFGYLVILFVVAFLMLVLAFLMQERNNTARIDDLQYSLDTIQSLDELMAENKALREENEALAAASDELEQVKAELEQANLELQRLKASPEEYQTAYDQVLFMNSRKSILLVLEGAMREERYEEAAAVCRDVNESGEFDWDPQHSERLSWDELRYYPDKRYVEIERELIEKGFLTYEEAGLTPTQAD